jgi:hypothetical protein
MRVLDPGSGAGSDGCDGCVIGPPMTGAGAVLPAT